ncbi:MULTISPECIES: TIGR03619 family F420-dependent LLM class oxidoreductase [unclassified Amycolatopsis]|uniref:TIGR03619 family F420-dependent LLM class oxidoreductase n=1 Tax=unclassified Amycolatopsis TaxID=2618356 RepID=UPI00287475D2|nr:MULTISPECIES: TIGR03619 family F420-dependent LLM class oxidoreductase [unclassified Amycolatopsis]MDS0140398.1 TIGR03619 family F420-dependent LLM class oxidoreductase [Amycolatopsis sp. 505]MDS0148997.1 TIGR03619 family F420-dependent LLM class oxidoreductase [Amycolatopsis sp. CM201R]
MKFGISYSTPFFGAGPETIAGFARDAEECGFESLYLPEHVALYPGAKIGPMALPPSLPFADPLECLSFVAAVTSRILLGTGVLLLPYHHPVVLAKRLATIDVLSGGRMRLLTVGVGALPGEARAAGVDFATRGRRTDEAIDVLRLLWAGGEEGVSFAGEFFSFEDACIFPKPAGVRTLPIHVGGSSTAAARRAGRRGDGYFPGGALTADERRRQFELVRATASDPETIEYTRWGALDMSTEDVEELARQGVTRIVVTPGTAEPGRRRAEMAGFAERFGLS